MVSSFIIFLVGLILLAKGADTFVAYSARLAKRFGVSDLVIGLTITSVGTSVPEMASTVSASISGHSGLVLGGIVGSNIANIGLILGISGIFRTFQADSKLFLRDGFVMLLATLIFLTFAWNGIISGLEGATLLVIYMLYLIFLVKSDREDVAGDFRGFVKFVLGFQFVSPIRRGIPRLFGLKSTGKFFTQSPDLKMILWEIFVVVLSCGAVIFGAELVVGRAREIAMAFHVSEMVIGLSLLAVGTSLPELVVSLSAARLGRGNIVLGNIIGSNIANILLVMGVASAASPVYFLPERLYLSMPALLFFTVGVLLIFRSKTGLNRWKSFLALGAYFSYMGYSFFAAN